VSEGTCPVEQQAGGRVAVRGDVHGVVAHDFTQRVTHDPRGVEHGGRAEQILAGHVAVQSLGQNAGNGLGGREVAGGQQGHDALARLLKEHELPHR
jgi:hypothetical protein